MMFAKHFSLGRKIIVFFLLLALLLPILSRPIMAFSTPTDPGSYLPNFEAATVRSEEMNLQSFVFETMKAVGASIFYAVAGCMTCTPEEREKYPGFILGNLIVFTYLNPPASGVKYIAKGAEKLGIARPVYAQATGKGFETMSAAMPIWSAFRNVSYLFFILIIVFMGFAVMFRIKISPQAVITIQSALPRIVLVLILITFSYAIVGFMIDIMYVFLALISKIFLASGTGIISKSDWWGPEIAEKFTAFVNDILTKLGVDVLFATLITNGIFFFLVACMAFFAILFLGPLPLIVAIIAAVLIFIALFRIAWTLIKAYAMVLIQLIFAPFLILMGALPGSKAIGNWFRNILANILVWPTIFAMLFIGSYLILAGIAGMFDGNLGEWFLSIMALNGFFLPALAKDGFAFYGKIILPFVGLGIILMAPKAADLIKSFFAGQPFQYGTALGQAIIAPVSYPNKALVFAGSAGSSIGHIASGVGTLQKGIGKLRGTETKKPVIGQGVEEAPRTLKED